MAVCLLYVDSVHVNLCPNIINSRNSNCICTAMCAVSENVDVRFCILELQAGEFCPCCVCKDQSTDVREKQFLYLIIFLYGSFPDEGIFICGTFNFCSVNEIFFKADITFSVQKFNCRYKYFFDWSFSFSLRNVLIVLKSGFWNAVSHITFTFSRHCFAICREE